MSFLRAISGYIFGVGLENYGRVKLHKCHVRFEIRISGNHGRVGCWYAPGPVRGSLIPRGSKVFLTLISRNKVGLEKTSLIYVVIDILVNIIAVILWLPIRLV